jgi:hypothetical protein
MEVSQNLLGALAKITYSTNYDGGHFENKQLIVDILIKMEYVVQ